METGTIETQYTSKELFDMALGLVTKIELCRIGRKVECALHVDDPVTGEDVLYCGAGKRKKVAGKWVSAEDSAVSDALVALTKDMLSWDLSDVRKNAN